MKGLKHIGVIALLGAVVLSACKENADERFSREAREFTKKNCPMNIEGMWLDSMTYERATRTIGYHYTFKEAPHEMNQAENKRVLLDGIKNSTVIRSYKDAGCSFRYVYSHCDSVVSDITITAEEYSLR